MVAGNNGGLLGLPYEISIVILILLLGILASVAFVLLRVRRKVHELHASEQTAAVNKGPGWWSRNWTWAMNNLNITIIVVVLLFVGTIGSTVLLYKNAQDLGSQVGYSPEQPIKFNHKLHAGQYGIQCQYCHTGVDKAKNASIPSLSTCMNCHNYIKQGPQYGTTEIAKIENAYNNKVPVEWVRIHNLPDHVFFSHAQHVNAGKLACENCHGNVREMERVQQVSTLEMGWCINCHRQTKVDSTNPYYKSTFDFAKNHKNFTIGQLGGVECSKCHY